MCFMGSFCPLSGRSRSVFNVGLGVGFTPDWVAPREPPAPELRVLPAPEEPAAFSEEPFVVASELVFVPEGPLDVVPWEPLEDVVTVLTSVDDC